MGDQPNEGMRVIRGFTVQELRDEIAHATGEYRADLIAEAVRRVDTYPRAWLPEDSRGLRA